jgi:hypothetical protein
MIESNLHLVQDPLKEELYKLNDQLITLQFDIIRYPESVMIKQPYSITLKDLVAQISTLLANLPSLDVVEANKEIASITQASDQLIRDWTEFKIESEATTKIPTTTTTSRRFAKVLKISSFETFSPPQQSKPFEKS